MKKITVKHCEECKWHWFFHHILGFGYYGACNQCRFKSNYLSEKAYRKNYEKGKFKDIVHIDRDWQKINTICNCKGTGHIVNQS